ncbi:MAG TPA: hypothetical protein VGH33_11970, partial [Isosphaeraceae bacterium]
PGEEPAEFEAERQGWIDDWNPRSHTRAVLVERAAAASWRLRRCVRAETARLTAAAEGPARPIADTTATVAEAMTHFTDDPGLLRRHPAGLDHLSCMLDGLLEKLGKLGKLGAWRSGVYYNALKGLLGYPAALPHQEVADRAYRRALDDAVGLLAYHVRAGGAPAEREAQGMLDRLRPAVERLRDRLLRAEATPARASGVAAVDASPEGRLLHRYEMAHDRSLRATIKQLIALAKSGADLAEPEAVEEKAVAAAATDAPTEADPAGAPAADRPTEANFGGLPITSGEADRVAGAGVGPSRRAAAA